MHSLGGDWTAELTVAQLPPHSFQGTTSADSHSHSFDRVPKGSMAGKRGKREKREKRGKRGKKGKRGGGDPFFWGGEDNPQYERVSTSSVSHKHTFTTNTVGDGQAIPLANPYYTLAFIMKL